MTKTRKYPSKDVVKALMDFAKGMTATDAGHTNKVAPQMVSQYARKLSVTRGMLNAKLLKDRIAQAFA